jgi:hypothetical protein
LTWENAAAVGREVITMSTDRESRIRDQLREIMRNEPTLVVEGLRASSKECDWQAHEHPERLKSFLDILATTAEEELAERERSAVHHHE